MTGTQLTLFFLLEKVICFFFVTLDVCIYVSFQVENRISNFFVQREKKIGKNNQGLSLLTFWTYEKHKYIKVILLKFIKFARLSGLCHLSKKSDSFEAILKVVYIQLYFPWSCRTCHCEYIALCMSKLQCQD